MPPGSGQRILAGLNHARAGKDVMEMAEQCVLPSRSEQLYFRARVCIQIRTCGQSLGIVKPVFRNAVDILMRDCEV